METLHIGYQKTYTDWLMELGGSMLTQAQTNPPVPLPDDLTKIVSELRSYFCSLAMIHDSGNIIMYRKMDGQEWILSGQGSPDSDFEVSIVAGDMGMVYTDETVAGLWLAFVKKVN